MKHAIDITLRRCLILIAILTTALLSSCHDKKDAPAEPEEETDAKHTILVYMVASNDLSGFDKSDITEIQQIFENTDVDMSKTRILLYQKTYGGSALNEVTAGGIVKLKDYDNSLLSVTVERMQEACDDMKALAPAKEYGLVLWSHATGWLQNGIADAGDTSVPRLRSYGSDNGNYMNITALASALKGAGFKYIYFDCCYMGGIEVAYELRDCADYMIMSPAEDPTNGMRYDLTIPCLIDDNLSLAERVVKGAEATFKYYNDTYSKGLCPCTLTTLRSDKVDKIAELTRKIYAKAERTSDPDHTYQRFKVSGACPYYDFEEYIETICDDADLLAQWRVALKEAILFEGHTPYIWNTPINRCCGLTTFILTSPASISNNNYNTLSWYNDVASALIK